MKSDVCLSRILFALSITCLFLVSGSAAAQSKRLDTLLLEAVKKNDLRKIKAYTKAGANPAFRDVNGATLLQWAALKGGMPAVEFLVKSGSDFLHNGRIYPAPGSTSNYGNLIGIPAAENKPEMLRYFVERLKIPVDDPEVEPAKRDSGWTALQWAAFKGNTNCMGYLINKGANVLARQNRDRNTPLHLAALMRHNEAMKLLLDHGANLFYFDSLKIRPITILTNYDNPVADYQTVVSSIEAIRKNTGNIYDVYRCAIAYFIKLDSAGAVIKLTGQYVDDIILDEKISGAQYLSYLDLIEAAYNYCGRIPTLLKTYRMLAATGPYRNYPVILDLLKSQEVSCLHDLDLRDELCTTAERYFDGVQQKGWNYYSMMTFVSWITSGGDLSGQVQQLRRANNSLLTYTLSDTAAAKLTKEYALAGDKARHQMRVVPAFKNSISAYFNSFDQLIKLYEHQERYTIDSLTALGKKMKLPGTDKFGSATVEIVNTMDTARLTQASTASYLKTLHETKSVSKSDRLQILWKFTQTLSNVSGVLTQEYERELADSNFILRDTAFFNEYLLMKIANGLHQSFPGNRLAKFTAGIRTMLDTLNNPHRKDLMDLFYLVQDIQYLPGDKKIDLYPYYKKFSNGTDQATRIALSTYALQCDISQSNIVLANECIQQISSYIDQLEKGTIDQPNTIDFDYPLGVLFNYDNRHPGELKNLYLLAAAVKASNVPELLKNKKALRFLNPALYEDYRVTTNASMASSEGKTAEIYTKMDRTVRYWVKKNRAYIPFAEKHTKFRRQLGNNAAFIDIMAYVRKSAGVAPDITQYTCYIYTDPITPPVRVEMFTDNALKEIMGDLSVYELTDPAKKQALYNLLWKPIEPYILEKSTIYISSMGALDMIPVDVVRSFGNGGFDKTFQVKYLLGDYHDDDLRDSPVNLAKMAVFGGIDYNHASAATGGESKQMTVGRLRSPGSLRDVWTPLPGSGAEVTFLRKLTINSEYIYSAGEATEDAFRNLGEEGREIEVIHLSTHGFWYPRVNMDEVSVIGNHIDLTSTLEKRSIKQSAHPLGRCGLVFAGANRFWDQKGHSMDASDGIVTGIEIANFDLSHTKLVVLSACNTAKVDGTSEVNLNSVAGAFKTAGVKYVLGSLWELPDGSTADFMELFYGRLKSGLTIETSFFGARDDFMKKYPDPYHWGAFQLFQ